MANKDKKSTAQAEEVVNTTSPNEKVVEEQTSSEPTSEEVSAENVAAATPAPGNPYTVSADGRGRPYDPAVDGAPGKEAEMKQAEADKAQ